MLEIRPEITQLRQIVAQAMGGAFDQIVALAPGKRGEIDFKFDVRFQVIDAQRAQAAQILQAVAAQPRRSFDRYVVVQHKGSNTWDK